MDRSQLHMNLLNPLRKAIYKTVPLRSLLFYLTIFPGKLQAANTCLSDWLDSQRSDDVENVLQVIDALGLLSAVYRRQQDYVNARKHLHKAMRMRIDFLNLTFSEELKKARYESYKMYYIN